MRILSVLAAVVTSALVAIPAFAEMSQSTPAYREGTHYHVLPEPAPVEDPDKIEVTEVFWYGCGHCFHFEPHVLEWTEELPEDISFVRLPAMWNRTMETHARAFYTAQRMGILEDVHQAIYNALNLDREPLDSAESVAALFAEFGADEEKAIRIFESAAATAFLKKADARARDYQISGTPQLIVGGRYRIEASRQVPQAEMFKVVDFLVKQIRAEQHGQQ